MSGSRQICLGTEVVNSQHAPTSALSLLVFVRLTGLRLWGQRARVRATLRHFALGSASLASLPFPNIMCGEAGACWLCALPCPNRSAPDDGHDRKSRVPQGQIGAPLLRDALSQVALP